MPVNTDQDAPAPDVVSARFNPLYRPYLVVTIGLTMVCSIVGAPLALIWFCGVGQWWSRHYFDLLQCTLDAKALRFRKGIMFQVEKTIPLENIQDVTFIEGPVLRKYQLSMLRFETASQNVGHAHAMQLTGIIDAHEFRNQILARRDALRDGARATPAPVAIAHDAEQTALMRTMLAKLDEIAMLLRERR